MTGEVKLIPIELTEEECRLFRLLREYKVFDIHSGNCVIHFDKDKKVSSIELHTFRNTLQVVV